LELVNGHRAITDAGAVRDLAGSLAEGVARHRAEVARRLSATVVVQLDEPLLPAALAGRLSGVTGLSAVHPIDEVRAIALIDHCVAALGPDVLLHCCAAEVPWNLLQRSSISAVSIDVDTLDEKGLDGLAGFIDSGRAAVLGMVRAVGTQRPASVEELALAAAALTDRLGFGRAVLRERIGISPVCGLAGATEAWARAATGLTERTAQMIADGAEAL
jgi:hypothetical protein